MSAPGCMLRCVRLTAVCQFCLQRLFIVDCLLSVLLTTTVYCIGTVRKKKFSFFFNFEMNKSTTAKKNKKKIFEISIYLFFVIFGNFRRRFGEPIKLICVALTSCRYPVGAYSCRPTLKLLGRLTYRRGLPYYNIEDYN